MKHWKFQGVIALLLFATLPQASRANRWCGLLALESKPPDVYYLLPNSIEFGHSQAESTVPPNAWRGLLPLRSSRADVERLLGPPTGLVASSYSYETKEEKVRVLYSQGPCEPSLEGQWKVPSDSVLSITVFPQTTVLVNNLRLDKRIYKRSQEVHPENWVWYVSETGVMVHAILNNGCEEVMSITYRPATKDEHFRCPKQGKTEGQWALNATKKRIQSPSLNAQTQSIPVFEQYGMISPDSEKAILDNFAIQLLDNQDLTGYVVLRRGQYSPKFAARKLRYIRDYLTKRRGVPASRVSAFEGKHRRDFSIELYLVSKGKPGPN